MCEETIAERVQLAFQLFGLYISQLTPLGTSSQREIAAQAAAENGLSGDVHSFVSLLILELYEKWNRTGIEPTLADWPDDLKLSVIQENMPT